MNPFTFSVIENEPMSRHTTLRVGGPARYYFVAKTRAQALAAVQEARERGIPYAVVGGGSNLLVADRGYQGLVVQIALSEIGITGGEVRVEAGVFSVALARAASGAGLAGVEWMVTLPGTVGGAVYGNAGAFGSEVKDHLASVQVLDAAGTEGIMPTSACGFGYRNSQFKKQRGDYIILAATFALKSGDRQAIHQTMNDLLAKRKDEQPLGAASAGCMFKNHIDEAGARVPAGLLIEQAGLKNLTRGRVRVSDRHANFFVNTGASAAEIRDLGEEVRARVHALYGVELEYEVQFLGF